MTRGTESTDSELLNGVAPTGAPIVSVLFGRSYAVTPGGKCELLDGAFELQRELAYYDAKKITYPGWIRPSLLLRDIDLYPWRSFTDLVVQGTARSERPATSLTVQLSCVGPKTSITRAIAVTGDRIVDTGPTGLRLSDAEAFTEMPIRYDKAYGGTDERTEAQLADPRDLEFLRLQLGDAEDRELSDYSYPRNPAGKGYLIAIENAVGLPWPNLQFPEDTLRLERLAAPLEQWGSRPYPAAFDWFPHAWFPRVAFFGEFQPTPDGRVPDPEARLGILDKDLGDVPLLERPKQGFAQGAHPFLARSRLIGDEELRGSAMSHDGRDFVAALPRERPRVLLRLLGGAEHALPASLDLVLAETDRMILSLVWRATLITEKKHLPIDWVSRSPYRIEWA